MLGEGKKDLIVMEKGFNFSKSKPLILDASSRNMTRILLDNQSPHKEPSQRRRYLWVVVFMSY